MQAHCESATTPGNRRSPSSALTDAVGTEVVELEDGETFDLEIAPVTKRIGDVEVRMLAYNRSIPGPTLKVRQGSTVKVRVTNRGDLDATVHWHGLRLDNRYDGTPETQAPIGFGETFTYELTFPDAGAYWYHPHIREDYGQELGLYGNIIVVPAEDDMVEVNRMTTPENTRWKLVDLATDAVNAAIDWRLVVGDLVKIRLINGLDSDHPMPHPFHIHGAGRFLILSRDGVAEPNLAWKDTVLVRTGEVVDILLEVTHPGLWMAHCHIAEHHEAGMMFSFVVTP